MNPLMVQYIIDTAILLTCVFTVAWVQGRRFNKWLRLGVGIVIEGHRVRTQYPFAYSQYRAEAVEALHDKGLDPLITLLPIEEHT